MGFAAGPLSRLAASRHPAPLARAPHPPRIRAEHHHAQPRGQRKPKGQPAWNRSHRPKGPPQNPKERGDREEVEEGAGGEGGVRRAPSSSEPLTSPSARSQSMKARKSPAEDPRSRISTKAREEIRELMERRRSILRALS